MDVARGWKGWGLIVVLVTAIATTVYLKDRREAQLIDALAKTEVDLSFISDKLGSQRREMLELKRSLARENDAERELARRDRKLANVEEAISKLKDSTEAQAAAASSFQGASNALVEFETFRIARSIYPSSAENVNPTELYQALEKMAASGDADRSHSLLRTIIWTTESPNGKQILSPDDEPQAGAHWLKTGFVSSYSHTTYPINLALNRSNGTAHRMGTGTNGNDLLIPFTLDSFPNGQSLGFDLVRSSDGIILKASVSSSLPIAFSPSPFAFAMSALPNYEGEGPAVRELNFPFVKTSAAGLEISVLVQPGERFLLGQLSFLAENDDNREGDVPAPETSKWIAVIFARLQES